MTFNEWFLAPVLDAIDQLSKVISMDMQQMEAKIDAMTAQNEKARQESAAAFQELKDELAKAGQTTPGVDAALARLAASIQADDDEHPDQPAG
jgi:phage shock protein A